MEKMHISGVEIEVSSTDQVLNMGGPWIGDLYIDGCFVSNNCVVNNFVFDEKRKLIFFVKYHLANKYYWYFTINFYNIKDKVAFEFEREFDMVYIKQFIGSNLLEIYRAFHGQFPEKRQVFDLDAEDFG